MDILSRSLVLWHSELENRCGYCKHSSGGIAYGMTTENLSVEDYKSLIDRGWRRSGKYCYKPTMNKTCCPQYTIKCDTENFCISKSHKKIIKRFNTFLNDGIYIKNEFLDQEQEQSESDYEMIGNKYSINLEEMQSDIANTITTSVQNIIGESCGSLKTPNLSISNIMKSTGAGDNANCNALKTKKLANAGTGADPNKPPCKKAKLLRLERKKQKSVNKNTEITNNKQVNVSQKSLDAFLEGKAADSKLKLKLTIIPNYGNEWDKVQTLEYELYKKYQITVHNDPLEKLSLSGFLRFLVHSPLKLTLVAMTQESTTFAVSEELYKKYQTYVHNEQPQEDEFCYFLVKTPLKHKPFPGGIEGPGYGSFHQQYWIDNKLIAVGVLDILPGCVSSVYFFYDPEYRNLTLGTYGSLREIQLVQQLHSKIPDLKYYYMGYYIHSCPKMRYKGKLKPSYLLCPETYVWRPIENCLPKLDINKYSRLNEDPNAQDEDLCSNSDLCNIEIFDDHKLFDARTYLGIYKTGTKDVFDMGKLIGKKTVHKLTFLLK